MDSTHLPGTANSDLLADAFEALAEGIAIFDADHRLMICNSRYREMLGGAEDLLKPGVSWKELIFASAERGVYADRHGSAEDFYNEALRHLRRGSEKRIVAHADGRTFEVSYNATRNGGFVVTRAEITDRLRAEAKVRDAEALLRTILDTNPTPVVMARLADSKILYRSPAAYDAYGDTEYASDFYIHAEDRTAYVDALRQSGRVRDRRIQIRGAGGKKMMVSVSGGLTVHDGETCVVSSVTDLTEQLEREAMIRTVVEACPAPILMNRAASGEILFKSPQISALFGEIDNASAFYENPEDRHGFLAALRAKGAVTEFRARFRNAQGKPIWCAISARLIQWEGEDVIVSHSRDLTPQLAIEAELGRQREQVFQSEKMSALGGLLAGVAHELNNPLSVVVGHAMMLQDEARDPATLRTTRKISEAAERCAKIIRTFLTMARQEPARMEETDLNELVDTTVEVARYGRTSQAINVTAELAAETPTIHADADQITQVVLNLVLNAEQAIEASGVGDTVRVGTQAGPETGSVTIVVEDNGPGVSPEVRARIFEPFFTTKGVGKGTGIGLAMCHRIVSAHDGTIEVAPASPRGARFTVTLPSGQRSLADAEATTVPEPQASALSATRVLVLDDEKEVADLNAEVLRRGGFEAEAVYRAEDAFELLRTKRFDVLISDLNMPGIDGRGVFDVIRDEFTALAPRTGFITGDTMGRASQRFLQESRRPYLEKPVSPKELRAFVTELTAGGSAQ